MHKVLKKFSSQGGHLINMSFRYMLVVIAGVILLLVSILGLTRWKARCSNIHSDGEADTNEIDNMESSDNEDHDNILGGMTNSEDCIAMTSSVEPVAPPRQSQRCHPRKLLPQVSESEL